MKRPFIFVFFLALTLLTSSWGFFAHMRINRLAVFTLPAGMNRFYKSNIQYLADHAVDADKRRYADTAEAPRHYLDIEVYEAETDSIPRKWNDAVKKYGLQKLAKNGTLPWQIQRTYYQLVKAFKDRDSIKILFHSAYIGHYISDAHVPLHTTENHNGQLSNQYGIHAFWESRLPELFSEKYSFLVGRALYIDDPLKETWKIITHTHQLVDSVLWIEAHLNRNFPVYRKYSYSKRNKQVMKQYSFEYSGAYHTNMNQMVARQMRASILATGSFWYSAWVDAGQPKLEKMIKVPPDVAAEKEIKELNMKFSSGKIIGRED
ncbi:zinc dependent phospholipase C family protein [Pedobacter cryoconitis]|uniref:S1/P1 nuclease n=1 Tax=Pedobacter cryoconitis TaxID=188932 RepID=A0A327SV83_9SPHI|nr:zinc dependent phospholipase C family protein [Pedobacter cryoconitis]RAJ31664.1 S1/P1 nuclease [Pedobacter cryoconitis]